MFDDLAKPRHSNYGAHRGFVAANYGIDITVAPGEIERGANFSLVAGLVLVDPGAKGDLEAELCGDGRDQLGAAGCRIGAHRAGVWRYGVQISPDLFSRRPSAAVRMGGRGKW